MREDLALPPLEDRTSREIEAAALSGGLCRCGCGQVTEIAVTTRRTRGWVKGKPKPFVGQHRKRLSGLAASADACELDPETGCWIWMRARNPNGYGVVRSPTEERQVYAHRLFYERANGPIPEGLTIDHLCNNPPCVNPAHLEAVSEAENIRRGFRRRFGHLVANVRRRHADGAAISAIARDFGINRKTVDLIVQRRGWAADPLTIDEGAIP
jgi:hypothetical protein